MTIQAIFFDIDGTLVDSNEQHVAAWEQVLREAGHPIDAETIRMQIGKGADMMIPALLPDSDEALQKRLAEAHSAAFGSRYLPTIQPFPGARDLVVRVREAGMLAVLASSASRDELGHYVDLLGVRDLLAATTSGDDVEHTKPRPDVFAAALERVAPLTADEVLVLGDTPYDIEAAKRCGIGAIAVRSGGFPDDVLREAGTIAIYDGVAALLDDFDRSPLAGAPAQAEG